MVRHLLMRAAATSLACLLLIELGLAQTPQSQAWQILDKAASASKVQTRADNARALGLITADPAAAKILQKALEDKESSVRAAAATSLGLIKDKSAIPTLIETAQKENDGQVVMAIAKSLVSMGEEKGYSVYYAIVSGEKKSGQGLLASEQKMLTDMIKNPNLLENEAFQQGMGFVPYGGVAFGAFRAIHDSGKSRALVKATAIKALAKDPDPRSGKALIAATGDPEWIVRVAAYDALARRGDASVIPEIEKGLNDQQQVVKLTAAAAIANLTSKRSPDGR